MGADAPLFAVAIGSALPVVFGGLAIVVLCLMALWLGYEFEGEIKAPLLTFRVRARPPDRSTTADGGDHRHAQQHEPDKDPKD